MRKLLVGAFAFLACALFPLQSLAKDWTVMVYINGHNNLDSYGAKDINEMEVVGSSDSMDVVVQWASLANKETRRLHVEKDFDRSVVNSQVVEVLPQTDMGNPENLFEFAQWSIEKYPADHYMLVVWNHGSGWTRSVKSLSVKPLDISFDDIFNSSINTFQLASIVSRISGLIGKKLDIYGSDACLMQMAEIAGQMKDSVEYVVGSEETEPGDGWPYDTWLSKYQPGFSAKQLSVALVDAYMKSYSSNVTMSALDMSKMGEFEKAWGDFSTWLYGKPKAQISKAVDLSSKFAYPTYVDVLSFVGNVRSQVPGSDAYVNPVVASLEKLAFSRSGSGQFSRVGGLSVWIPKTYNSKITQYKNLEFHKATGWGETLEKYWR